MAEVKIYIDNKLVDLPTEELNLNLSYSLKDREGIAINTGSRSEYSFEFPCTHNNDNIFSRFYDVSEQTSSKQVYLPARIEVDGLPFFNGLAQLTSVTINEDLYYWNGQNWKISFYGNNVDWVTQLKNKFLYQYNYGTHTFDYLDNINANSNFYANGDTYKYILIKWKDWLVSGQVSALEMTPALFVKAIVDRIFTDIGYTYQSNFFNTASFEKLVMPIPLAKKIIDPKYGNDYLNIEVSDTILGANGNYYPFIMTNQTVTPPLASPNPYDTTTGFYTVPFDGFYYVVYTVEVIEPVNNYQITTYISRNGALFPVTVPLTYYTTPFGANGNITYTFTSNVLSMVAGETLSVFMQSATVVGTTQYNITMQVFGEANVSAGVIIDFQYFINKEWNSLDFIKGLAHAFNLTFQTDVDNKNVIIEPSNTYLNQSSYPSVVNVEDGFYNGTPVDLTQFVDLIKGGEVYSRSDINQLVKLSWQYDSADPTLEAISGVEDITLHQARFTFTANRFQRDEDVIENPFFSSTLCIADSTIQGANTTKTPIIPIIWSQNYLETTLSSEANYDIMPRLLTSDKILSVMNGTINIQYDSVGNVAEFPCVNAYMVDYNNTTGEFISLSFGTETVNGFSVRGLLHRFYLADFVRRQSGKEVECYIFWDTLMIRTLDFRKPVKIHGDNYILQEINMFSVTSNVSTKTYLIYDYLGDSNDTSISQISNSLIVGKLNV